MNEHRSSSESHGASTLDHEYDGIKEYDNPLPKWWVWTFWATFFFSIGYAFHYHWSGHGKGRLDVLEEETRIANELAMKAAAKEQVTEDSLTKLAANQASVASGAAIFAARCQSCHAEKGKGLIGPNLTDAYWLHGFGTLMDIYKTVGEGVLAKGMPAWNKQLSPIELRNVVSYVASLRGLNLPGKEPQGTLVSNGPQPTGSAATSAAPVSAGTAQPGISAQPDAAANSAPSAAPAVSAQVQPQHPAGSARVPQPK
ncbi:MAG: cbb3-type cytochrome c oxidase N-terminal domain-containing protein [Polyangiaceae bacterium]